MSYKLECEYEVINPKWLDLIKDLNDVTFNIISKTLKYVDSNFSNICNEVELSVIYSDDESITPINNQYLGKNKPTNIISFPAIEMKEGKVINEYEVPEGYCYLGEIIVSYETLMRESEENNITFLNHFTHIVIHGLLHLMGYNHIEDVDADIMEPLEETILSEQFNIKSPYKSDY